MKKFDVCVLGLGYIGLPTASVLATKGKSVLGVDTSPTVLKSIQEGRIDLLEPDLDIIVKAAVQSGNLQLSPKPQPADVFIIAVPTPLQDRTDASICDLSFVESAARSVASCVKSCDLIILESTSPVGTTERVREWIYDEISKQKAPNMNSLRLYFAYGPERVLPGQMLKELVTNDRIAGGLDTHAAKMAAALYRTFCSGEIYLTDSRTAEMVKLTENAFRDVNIAFANEISMISDEMNLNSQEVICLASRHPRVKILRPGPGVGGHCIAVDPWFIVQNAPEHSKLIRAAREVNNAKPLHIIKKIRAQARLLKEPVIACLGLVFKANVSDLRESPALQIVSKIAEENIGRILVVEPNIQKLPPILLGQSNVFSTELDHSLQEADIIVILVAHREFRSIIEAKLADKIVIDVVGLLEN